MTSADAVDKEYCPRPGTPMIGPYSVNQMDDFYAALAAGEVKPTGIMNYLQRLFVSQRCRPGDRVVDVCCGRGLQLPVLHRYCRDLHSYTGLDISPVSITGARERQGDLDASHGRGFPVTFHECDVARNWPVRGPFTIAVYTSALEHLPRKEGTESLRHVAAALAPAGRLFLSTPNTPGEPPRRLQHRVHVYEWSHEELRAELDAAGLSVDEIVGILPPTSWETTERALADRFGDGAVEMYREMRRFAPDALLGPVLSTALGDAASEVLYVCSRRPA